jgi:hypothetical protein
MGKFGKKPYGWMRPREFGFLSARDDDFGNAVFGQKLTEARPLIEQILNDQVREGPLNGERLRELHFYGVTRGDVEAAVGRFFGLFSGMKERENLAARI